MDAVVRVRVEEGGWGRCEELAVVAVDGSERVWLGAASKGVEPVSLLVVVVETRSEEAEVVAFAAEREMLGRLPVELSLREEEEEEEAEMAEERGLLALSFDLLGRGSPSTGDERREE